MTGGANRVSRRGRSGAAPADEANLPVPIVASAEASSDDHHQCPDCFAVFGSSQEVGAHRTGLSCPKLNSRTSAQTVRTGAQPPVVLPGDATGIYNPATFYGWVSLNARSLWSGSGVVLLHSGKTKTVYKTHRTMTGLGHKTTPKQEATTFATFMTLITIFLVLLGLVVYLVGAVVWLIEAPIRAALRSRQTPSRAALPQPASPVTSRHGGTPYVMSRASQRNSPRGAAPDLGAPSATPGGTPPRSTPRLGWQWHYGTQRVQPESVGHTPISASTWAESLTT